MLKRNVTKSNYSWKEFFNLINLSKPKKGLFIIACVISATSAVTTTFVPNFLKQTIDSFVEAGNLNAQTIILLIGLFIFQTVTGVLAGYLLSIVGLNMISNLRKITWDRIVKLPAEFFDKNESGDISSRLVNDSSVIYNLVTASFSQFINAILMILFCGFWLFYYDWQLSMIILLAIPLFLLFFIPLGTILANLSKRTQLLTAKLNVSAIEMISENKLVKSFTAEKAQVNKGFENINALERVGVKQAKWMATVNPMINLIMMVMIISIIGYGGVKLGNGEISPGTFIAFLTLIFYIVGPINNFGMFFSQLQRTKGATERISKLLYEANENHKQGKHVDIKNKNIEFKNVSFKYTTKADRDFTLKNINLTFKSGQTYALVGPSGSGKTTFISLFERFYQPTLGCILVDSKNIEDISLNSWRSQIGYVSQEHSLVSGTIRDNILFGVEGEMPSDERIKEVCEMAYAWEFIKELPNGIDTHIGEKGLILSGGQKQRIAIARLFLKNPNIILLDEATANLDSKSEQKVQAAMSNLTKGRTSIIIAHRLSTIINAENIIFLDKGRVTGLGKHEELKETHQLYNQFCKLQLQA